MLIRLKGTNFYSGRVTFSARGEVQEVEEEEAIRLLHQFPDWFEAVGGQDAGGAEPETPPQSEKSLPAAPRKKPYKAKGK